MSDKNLYRLTRGQWLRYEPNASGGGEHVRYTPGDIIAGITKLEMAEHGKKLVLVTQEELDRAKEVDDKLQTMLRPKSAAPADGDQEDYEWGEVLDGSAATIKEYINDILSDPAMVESLMQAEMAGQNRKTVVSAANDRLAQLAKTTKGA